MTASCLNRASDDARCDGARIALVEDDHEMAQAMRHVLVKERYDVQVYADASQALAALRTQRPPDLILLDLWTPGMNGWQFRLEQKRDPRLARVPLIAMSADRSPHAAAIDADAFLAKPITSSALLASTRELLMRIRDQPRPAPVKEARQLSLDDWNALYVILTDLRDARAHTRELVSELTGFTAARAIALNVLLERAESCARLSLGSSVTAAAPARRATGDLALSCESVDSFLAWSEAGAVQPAPAQVMDLLAAFATCIKSTPRPHKLRFTLEASGALLVEAKWGPLAQVLSNLLRNAFEALEGAPEPALHVELRSDARNVELRMADCGGGAHVGDLERAFDPFFTTKRGHAGLGLTVARRIATSLRGSLTLEREPAGGTAIRLILPRATELLPILVVPEATPKVLLIHRPERGAELKQLLEGRLQVQLATPEEALGDALNGAHYDLVLCALVMPTMTGFTLMSALAVTNPALAGRLVMLVPPEFGTKTEELLADLRVWHVSECLPVAELAAFAEGLLELWRGLRLR